MSQASYSSPRHQVRHMLPVGTATGTWPATGSAAVGTATGFAYVLPWTPFPMAIVGAKLYRSGTGGTFSGVTALLYNGTDLLGSNATKMTFNDTTDDALAAFEFAAGPNFTYPFSGTNTAANTLSLKLTGTTTASIAATNEIITAVFTFVEGF